MISEKTTIKHPDGTPEKAVTRMVYTGVKFTEAEYLAVKQKTTKAGMTVTSFIRQMALQGKILPRMNEEERQIFRQLVGMANNFNQLAKKGHQEGLLAAVLMFEKYRNTIDKILEQLENDK